MNNSLLVVDADGTLYDRGDAVLTVLTSLGGAWRVLKILWLVPRPIRDVGYRIVARSRYRLFGKRETCRVPSPEERASFL